MGKKNYSKIEKKEEDEMGKDECDWLKRRLFPIIPEMLILTHTYVKDRQHTIYHRIERLPWQLRLRKTTEGRSCGSLTNTPLFCREDGCLWIFNITSFEDGDIKFYLERKEYKQEYQSVNVRLTIVDSFNLIPFYASKDIDFTPSHNEECLMRVTKNDLYNGIRGLNKIRFVPNDTLTLKWEMATYENTNNIHLFTTEEEFQKMLPKCLKKEVCKWLLFLLLIGFAMISILYVNWHFVVPYIGRFLFIPNFVFSCVTAFCSFGLFMLLSYLLRALNKVWHYISLGGDRTYYEPPSS